MQGRGRNSIVMVVTADMLSAAAVSMDIKRAIIPGISMLHYLLLPLRLIFKLIL